MKLEFSTDFRKKKAQISNFVKIRSVGAELLHAEGRTDMTKLIVVFRNFPNAPKTSEFSAHFVFTHFVRSFQSGAISLYALNALHSVMWAFEQYLYV